jgi:RNA recognition motif-containing protein
VSSGFQVVVHNLPWNTTWQQLRDAFADTGDIQRVDVIIDSAGRSRGFGTVRYATKEEAESAAEKMNNTKIGNRTISVRIDRFA